MLMNLLAIIVFLLMFMVLVSVHELGHYLFARYFNMGVSEFSVGMGRPILKTWGRRKYTTDEGEEQETLFNFRAWPIGGFVKILGMEPDEEGNEKNVVGGFYSKPPWQRIVVLLAGPIFSLAFGWIVLVSVFATSGIDVPNNVVSLVEKGLPADTSGLKLGDRVLSIDGHPISKMEDAVQVIRSSDGKPMTFKISRGGNNLDLTIKPILSAEERAIVDKDGMQTGEFKKVPQIGLLLGDDHVYPGLWGAMSQATEFPVKQVGLMFNRITRPQVLLNNSAGPVGMAVVTKQVVSSGLSPVIEFAGMISLSLGIFNLLPIGPLDGGQILLSLIEWIRRGKRVSIQAQIRFIVAGVTLMLGLFCFRFYKDLVQFVIPGKENMIIGTGKKSTPADPKPDSNSPTANNAPVK